MIYTMTDEQAFWTIYACLTILTACYGACSAIMDTKERDRRLGARIFLLSPVWFVWVLVWLYWILKWTLLLVKHLLETAGWWPTKFVQTLRRNK